MAQLGKRPSNPAEISFDPECFEQRGIETIFVVQNKTGYGYPREFKSKEEAVEARRGTQVIIETTRPVMVRVRWK